MNARTSEGHASSVRILATVPLITPECAELRLAQIKTRRLEIQAIVTEWRRAFYIDGIKTPMENRIALQAEEAQLAFELDAIKRAADGAKQAKREQLRAQRDQLLGALQRLVWQVETGFFDHVSAEHQDSSMHAARAAIKATEVPA
jgi:hypothetical protein